MQDRLIATIENEPITERLTSVISWKSKAAIDVDGSGDSHGDPYYQNDTSLHLDGKALNADVDRYIVVPPAIIKAVEEIVLGCQAIVVNTLNNKSTQAVVGDIGPHNKLGEISRATAIAIGIDGDPVSGGVDKHVISYRIYPGIAAVVNGKHYALQPYSS